jgi:hypothetical protein
VHSVKSLFLCFHGFNCASADDDNDKDGDDDDNNVVA